MNKKVIVILASLFVFLIIAIMANISTNGNKNVSVCDGTYNVNFKIPAGWTVETRHSGDKKLSVTEMREYLSTCRDGGIKVADEIYPDYSDVPLSKLKDLPSEEIEKMFNRPDDEWLPYPSASVSADKHISYSDTAWKQIDLHILHDFNKHKTYFNEVRNGMKDLTRTSEMITGIMSEVISFPLDKDDKGNEMITKMGTGGKIFFVPLNGGKDMLVINKQAKGDPSYEKEFDRLLKSLTVK